MEFATVEEILEELRAGLSCVSTTQTVRMRVI